MNYKLIAMDFDGTLLNSNKNISKNTKNILKLYRDLGYIIVGVTGRNLSSVKTVLPVDIFNYIIINNGVSIYNAVIGKCQNYGFLLMNDIKNITNIVENCSKEIDFITEKYYYIYLKKKENNYGDFIKTINSLSEIDEVIVRMNIYFKNNDDVLKYYDLIRSNYNNINCFIMQDSESTDRWLVVNPKGINKAYALKKLGIIENIELTEMIYFGDGLNDLEVMKSVGLSVAMGNALDLVKKNSKDITKTNNEDGIVWYLDKKINRKI